ncbi:rhamnogalacturonan acetylesterase [Neiella sp. HB171785]|uniref:Rhamnogalacturonan acetylesterase n=1 Tax=Neiella litorisoli TaxID=2771431 RepID=A0A8J6QTP7_9GAMM|nr:rhamnogalacturonan acetylesterase [Neiella litorisoli]MBD1389017.1 rhamnogalacturonan acetylesterase [Neiella litorisoli]
MKLINLCKTAVIISGIFISQIATAGTTIFMAGDSTMAIKDPKDYPETGWGVPFATFFADDVKVVNLAKNGRSTRTFKTEGLWQQIESQAKTGDWVFIQFGHNDESEKKHDRYTTPEQYKSNLTEMIRQSQARGATPILLSSVTRRNFDDNGNIKKTHPYYPLVLEVAEATGVTFIDMDAITRDYFSAMGDSLSKLRFMHIQPDLHPNYPNGVSDNTHFNELGAREVAQLVLTELKKRQHPLTKQLRSVDPKHLKLRYKP